jgi:hypothetical protein
MTINHYERILRERDEAREIIAAALKSLPVGYIPAHTPESIPERIADLCKAVVDADCERDEARTTIEDAKRALNATNYEGILLAALRVKEERDEARELLASEKITRDHVIKRGIEMQKERDEAREVAQQMTESNHVLMADTRFYRNAWEQLKEETK